jgi:alpha-tubulin suppressor-like RCC1 family protein
MLSLAGCKSNKHHEATNNLILQIKMQDLARAELIITGPGLSAPLKYQAEGKDGEVNQALNVPPGAERTYALTLYDKTGTVIARGASRGEIGQNIDAGFQIPLLPLKGGQQITASLSTHRILITQQVSESEHRGAIEFHAQIFDADGEELPMKPGMLDWNVYAPPGGRFVFDPTRPGIGYYYPLIPVGEVHLNPCVCVVGSSSCVCQNVPSLPKFVQVSAGNEHSCAIDSDGNATCWGANNFGQLGHTTQSKCASYSTSTVDCSTTPVQVDGQHAFASVSAGWSHTCGVDTAGKAWCWGNNYFGQLGLGGGSTPTNGGPTPQLVAGSMTYSAISVGMDHTCALGTDHIVYCWGAWNSYNYNNYGQVGHEPGSNVGTGTMVPRAIGSIAFNSLSAGEDYNCGITIGGSVMCWGNGNQGQLGYDQQGASNPTSPDPLLVAIPPSVPEVSAIAAGGEASCAGSATKSDPTSGSVACWGNTGLLAYNVVRRGPQKFLAKIRKLTLGGYYTFSNQVCAIDTFGNGFCWGDNTYGETGIGSAGTVVDPTPVASPPTKFVDIDTGPTHTCGIDGTNQLWCWGSNYDGQLGNGTQAGSFAPARVAVPPPLPVLQRRLGP